MTSPDTFVCVWIVAVAAIAIAAYVVSQRERVVVRLYFFGRPYTVAIRRDGPAWVAMVKEVDVVAQGPTRDLLLARLQRIFAVSSQLEAAAGRSLGDWKATPVGVWDDFVAGRSAEFRRVA